ncbi:MAG: hypothetical protein H6955_21265 [Chromatiaceae bacterium]|nr:hypothetical protein [Gammaproteobacteria bacterium]MCP5316099.1 hypothetical protein [Chromatiaceae bacterium]
MTLVNCKNLRNIVVTALVMFGLGFALQVPRALFGTDFPILTTLLSGIGLATMTVSPFVMIATAVATMLPKVSQRLALCEH